MHGDHDSMGITAKGLIVTHPSALDLLTDWKAQGQPESHEDLIPSTSGNQRKSILATPALNEVYFQHQRGSS